MLCKYEIDYTNDAHVVDVLRMGNTPQNILEAARLIKAKENSGFIKLPVDISHDNGDFSDVISCLALAENENVILKVQGAFSNLFSKMDMMDFCKQIRKNKNEMHEELENIVCITAEYIDQAIKQGVKIISFADSSAVPKLWGEKVYQEFIAVYQIKLFEKIRNSLKNAVVHICPQTSNALERYGFMNAVNIKVNSIIYLEALLEVSSLKNVEFIGGMCINHTDVLNGTIKQIKLI